SAAAVTAIIYDHSLTLADEVWLIWFNPQAGAGKRISFIANRYSTEAALIYIAYIIMVARVYVLWDRRTIIKWILMSAFAIQTVGFGLFVIVMTIFNALDRPHQKQADVVIALVHDGARLFLVWPAFSFI
ncbi:hypothetical protein K438DRAFT_1584226, partial [Mycena galopus ATCC 62051]